MIACVDGVLYFGDGRCCTAENAKKFAIVHACKEPCHREAVGYVAKSLPTEHPNYLALERQGHLYLNLIDPPAPLFKIESFQTFLRFAALRAADGRPLLIHCNQGGSRAPSLALLAMAKTLNAIPDESYGAARAAFEERFPYSPGRGIATFLDHHWQNL